MFKFIQTLYEALIMKNCTSNNLNLYMKGNVTMELKTGSWAETEVATLKDKYVPQDMATVEALATELGRSKRSVIGKLVSEGVYVAPEKPKAKPKEEGPTKGQILQAIVDEGFDVTGLETATKPALTRFRDFVASKG